MFQKATMLILPFLVLIFFAQKVAAQDIKRLGIGYAYSLFKVSNIGILSANGALLNIGYKKDRKKIDISLSLYPQSYILASNPHQISGQNNRYKFNDIALNAILEYSYIYYNSNIFELYAGAHIGYSDMHIKEINSNNQKDYLIVDAASYGPQIGVNCLIGSMTLDLSYIISFFSSIGANDVDAVNTFRGNKPVDRLKLAHHVMGRVQYKF